jgi:hypothetical protein
MSTTQWANIGDDAGAPHALVARLAEYVPPTLVDYLWIFPPRRVAAGESTVLVVAAFDEHERRRVLTGRFTVARDRRGTATVRVQYDEHGTAPDDAVPRIVQGVLRRLGEDAAAEPAEVHVAGLQQRWDELITELGGRPGPPVAEEPVEAVEAGAGAEVQVAAEAEAEVGLAAEAEAEAGADSQSAPPPRPGEPDAGP